jgi:hypothetical protein
VCFEDIAFSLLGCAGKYKTLKHNADGSYSNIAMKGVGMHVKIQAPDQSIIMAKDYEGKPCVPFCSRRCFAFRSFFMVVREFALSGRSVN